MTGTEFEHAGLAGRLSNWAQWTPLLLDKLRRPEAVRLGESAVLSTCVHLLKQHQPGIVTILPKSDAGKVFYRRKQAGEVFHLDVFHQAGDVSHHLVARLACQAISRYMEAAYGSPQPASKLADYVDIQTATGGGRITGALVYGLRSTLQRAHRNHVHLAAMLPVHDVICLFYLLAALEQAVVASGLELRRVEGLEYDTGGTERISLADYTSPSDSMLRGNAGDLSPEDRSGSDTGSPLTATDAGDYAAARADLLAALTVLTQHLESTDAVDELFQALASMSPPREVLQVLRRQGLYYHGLDRALAALSRDGFLRPCHGDYVLTPRGRLLVEFASRHSRELRLALRLVLHRRLREEANEGLGRTRVARGYRAGGRFARRHVAVPKNPGGGRDISWPDSVLAAARRLAASRVAGRQARLVLAAEDLHVINRYHYRPVDVFLLIDASASMSGERMRAAKTLARHLLLTSRDRVAVITFQERQVRVTVPLTRNSARVENGLATIRPFGLTPMASGLAVALDYVRSSRPRNPLVILITDGIPTVPHDGKNPLDDAIKQASRWRQIRAGFTCIGLQPNERYLKDLVKAAGGTLHIVDELEAETLVAIASAERNSRLRRHDA